MMRHFLASLAVVALALAAPAAAQQPATPLFASDAPIRLTVTAPLQGLIHNRESGQRAAGSLTEADGRVLPISLKLRGITRRTAEVCDFPPLRVDFTAPPPAASLFAGQDKLKLVTHCRNSPSFQQYLLLEVAAYRMYNLLTPHSFRVRLAEIDYRDPGGRELMTRTGFFIEDLRDVARRNGMRQIHAGERIPVADLSAPDAARYALFQHMISNHDWSMRAGPPGEECCHNAQLIGTLGAGSAIPVPYDFDFSGMVSTPYAHAPDELQISDVRQRVYRGYCMHNADAIGAARQMRALRPQLLGVLTQVPGLEPRTQQRAAAFLERFSADIATDEAVGAKVLNHCVG